MDEEIFTAVKNFLPSFLPNSLCLAGTGFESGRYVLSVSPSFLPGGWIRKGWALKGALSLGCSPSETCYFLPLIFRLIALYQLAGSPKIPVGVVTGSGICLALRICFNCFTTGQGT